MHSKGKTTTKSPQKQNQQKIFEFPGRTKAHSCLQKKIDTLAYR